jgi:hypothetical protein
MFIDGKGNMDRSLALRAVDLRPVGIVQAILISVLVLITVPLGAVRAGAA